MVSVSRHHEGDDPEYRATVILNHGTAPTRAHLQALVDAVLAELVDATEWSASLDTRAGSRVKIVALFRAPDRRVARYRQRAALHAAQQVNGKVSKNDRCGKPDFVRILVLRGFNTSLTGPSRCAATGSSPSAATAPGVNWEQVEKARTWLGIKG